MIPDSQIAIAMRLKRCQAHRQRKKGLISNGIPQLQWILEQSQGWQIAIPNDIPEIPEKRELSWQGRAQPIELRLSRSRHSALNYLTKRNRTSLVRPSDHTSVMADSRFADYSNDRCADLPSPFPAVDLTSSRYT